MFRWLWKKVQRNAGTELPWMQAMDIPLLASLNDSERQSLIVLAEAFLRQKKLVTLQDLALDDSNRCRLALLFCLPVLALGLNWLDGFHDVLIYPATFIVEDEWQDEAGLIHHARTVHSGQSWLQGPIIINWRDVEDSFDLSGFNLVIHEVAHKLDARGSGEPTGVPSMSLRDVAEWERDLLAAMNAIQDEVDLVGEHSATIDAYAASDPAECFAVLSEYFFSAPELLLTRFPRVYQRMTQFYRQDPWLRLQQQKPCATQ